MFDNQHIENDLKFRSILEAGQEEVPARCWDGIASGLDRLERRKSVMLWWRRAGVSAAAIAAAVAIGIVLHHPVQELESPSTDGMVAVVESPTTVEETTPQTIAEVAQQTKYLAYTPKTVTSDIPDVTAPVTEQAQVPVKDVDAKKTATPKTAPSAESENVSPYNWEEEKPKKRREVALVLSSNTGANSGSRNGASSSRGILKRPSNPSALQTSIAELGDSRFSIPVSFGVGVKVELSEKWSLGTGVNYTLLSRKFDGDFLKIEDGSIAECTKSVISNQQHYIGIPLNAYYNIISKEKVNFYAYAGGAVEKCVANNYRILESKSTHKEKASGVQWSANIGVGVEFMLGKHLGIYLDPSARYYFDCKQPKSIRTAQPLMFGAEIGLRTKF